jgi:hypothetical protein
MDVEETRLFTIPVAKLFVPETEALKQQFMPEMLRRYRERRYQTPVNWETDRVHTSFESERKDWIMDPMPAAYRKLVLQFAGNRPARVQLWHNLYWTGQEYQERHHHIPCHFSFIHFLAFDKAEHRPPVFYDPARLIKAHCQLGSLPPEVWEDRAQIEVSEGDALVFPSYLEHYVPPGAYRNPRITVSMNVTLTGDA